MSAEKMRRYRARRAAGKSVLPIEVDDVRAALDAKEANWGAGLGRVGLDW
jgi:hypothetical protein